MSHNGTSEAYTPPQEAQELTEDRYYELVECAYEVATAEGFNPTQFVAASLTRHLELAGDSANWVQTQENLVYTGEVLGCALTTTDYLETVDRYEQVKADLKGMSPAARSFSRLAVVTDIRASEAVAGKKQVAQTNYVDAQLLSILA